MHLFESLIEPAAALTVHPTAAARHRYGGLPALPDGTAWPTYDGTPMTLLAHLDCADLAALLPETWTLPTSGTLLFFHRDDFTATTPPAPGGGLGDAAGLGGSASHDAPRWTHGPGSLGRSGWPGGLSGPSQPGGWGGPSESGRPSELDGSDGPGVRSGEGGPDGANQASGPGGPGEADRLGGTSGRGTTAGPGGADRLDGTSGRGATAGRGGADRHSGADGLGGADGPEHDDGCRVLHVPTGLPLRPAPAGVKVIPPLALVASRVGSVPPYDAPTLRHAFTTDPVAAMNARELAEDAAGRPPRHQVLGWQRDAFLHLPGLRPLLQLEAEPGTAWGKVVNVSFWLPEADLAAGRLTAARRYLETA